MQAKTLNRWTVLHRWTSLFCTLNLLLLLVTGLLLIFHDEIDHALGLVPKIDRQVAQALISMDQAVQFARAAKPPDWNPSFYFEVEDLTGLTGVALTPPGVKDFTKAETVFLNAYTGEVLRDFDPEKTFTGWMLHLHADLFLGFGGSMYLAVVGLAFFVALVSGAVVYAPFMRGLTFGFLRRNRGTRVFQLDLHNLAGVVSLGWCSVVALTGVILELNKPIAAIYQMTDLARMTAPYRNQPLPTSLAPLEQAVQAARAAWPGYRVASLIFPGTQLSGEHHYAFFMATRSGFGKQVFKLALVDASTGKLTVASDTPWYVKGLLASGPLHFGNYGGLPLKIIWACFTLLTLGLCVGGLYLTVSRLRVRRRASVTAAPGNFAVLQRLEERTGGMH